jgi:peptidoglycan/LPS O-acetylase OafA/YrhL
MAAHGEYRRDIDGLRAVAVLPVLFYHAGVPFFTGGYVGVDIFFVISGFLIAGIIAREVDQKKFSILTFYERRARRILPALMVMMAVVLLGAALLYFPEDFARVPKSALMAIAFLSNVGFFMETGYFAGGAETMPLLHTWSLAVEEQFYFGFPILLILIARYRPTARQGVIAGLALISFVIAVLTQADGTGSAFYLLPARAWELFIGALLAVGGVRALSPGWGRESAAIAGLALIIIAIFGFDSNTVFPGVNALLPVIGAALIIHSAPGTFVGRLLSARAMVGVGLISYSLYLWHWPVIVFSEYARDESLTGWASVAAIVVSFGLAWCSWRFVERPFRASGAFSPRWVFTASAASMATLSCLALAMVATNGWSSRFSADTLRLANAKTDVSPVRDACMGVAVDINRPACILGAPVAPTAMVWGDSHGVEIAWALSETMKQSGTALIQNTRGSCPPIIGYRNAADPLCADANKQIVDFLRANATISTVYLTAFWAGERYGTPENAALLDKTIAALKMDGRKIVLIGAVPSNDFEVPRRLANQSRFGDAVAATGSTLESTRARDAWIRRYFAKWEASGVTIIDPQSKLCGATHCSVMKNGQPLYFDSHHLSLVGARMLLAR